MWATLSFRFDILARLRPIDKRTLIMVVAALRPRIEGSSLDRQEKCITFFRILPTHLDIDFSNCNRICLFFYINIIVFIHIRVFLYRCESTSTRTWIRVSVETLFRGR